MLPVCTSKSVKTWRRRERRQKGSKWLNSEHLNLQEPFDTGSKPNVGMGLDTGHRDDQNVALLYPYCS